MTTIIYYIIAFVLLNELVAEDIQCGISNTKESTSTKCDSKSESRIINGQCAKPGQVPWVTLVQIMFRGRAAGMCGGAILDKWTIMTAAHCAFICIPYIPNFGIPVQQFNISVGDRTLRNSSDGQTFYLSNKAIVNPNYKRCSENNTNDIALLKISGEGMNVPHFTDIGLGSTNSICQPTDSTDYAGQIGTIAGWGRTSSQNYDLANILQYAHVDIINNTKCKETYEEYVDDNMICAFGSNGQSSCNGDSGTALYVEEPIEGANATKAIAVGITSFGVENCEGAPVVYTRVSKFLDFINANLGAPS